MILQRNELFFNYQIFCQRNLSQGFQIFLRLSIILPDGANLLAGVLVGTVTASLVALGGYTFMHLAQMAAEVELDAFHTAPCTINALGRDLVGVIHLAPFLRHLDAHLVVIHNRGDASFASRAVDATACNHFIHIRSYFQSQHPDRPSLALVLFFVYASLACGNETALLHHSARGRIIHKVAADERFDVCRLADMV